MVSEERGGPNLAGPKETTLNSFFKNSGDGKFQLYIKVEIVYIEPPSTFHPTSTFTDIEPILLFLKFIGVTMVSEPIVFLNCCEFP